MGFCVIFFVGFCGIIGVFASVWPKTTDGIAMASEYLFLIDSDMVGFRTTFVCR